jgi:hypothetical protein
MSKSKLEEWAYELDPDYPQDGTIEVIQTQTHRELMRKRSIQGALWLLEQLEKYFKDTCHERQESGAFKPGQILIMGGEIIEVARKLCGKEGES